MKSIRNLALATGCAVLATAGFAQETKVTTSTSAVGINKVQPQDVKLATGGNVRVTSAPRPQVTFPPTPPPKAPVVPMTQQQLDEHILPRNILSQTSDVIALSYNGFRRSQLDPCGCVSHQLGGLDKEARILTRFKELNIPTVMVDAGGYVRDNPTDPDMGRSGILLKALHTMGLKVANVGYTDIGAGPDKIKSLAKDANVDLISANVSDASGKLLFEPYSVETVKTKKGDVKVGFIGVTRPRIPVPKRKPTSGTVEAATPRPAVVGNDKSGGATVGDMQEALQKYVPELRQKADIVVALIFDRRDKVAEFLKDLPAEAKVDVAVAGEFLQAQANVLDTNGVKLVSGGYEGRQSGMLTFTVENKKIAATSNEFIEILQSIPTVPEITKYVNEAKNLTLQPTTITPSAANPTHINPAEAAKLNLSKNGGTTAVLNAIREKEKQKEAEKGSAPAKLDLGNP